jgi:two-component system, cell cycle response regulator DivK
MAESGHSKLLIIDDDQRNIFALRAVLKSRGYICVTATGAKEGIRLLQEQADIGLVLLDMMMPEMDGYEAMTMIRQKRGETVPIIAVTAQAMVGDREKCIAAGANDYIAKPVDVDRLMVILQQYLQ